MKKFAAWLSAIALFVTMLTPVTLVHAETSSGIVSVEKAGGNTTVKLENITEGVVIGVKYDDDGRISNVKTTDEIKGDTATIEGVEADKVFVWKSLISAEPLCAPSGENSNPTPTETTNPNPDKTTTPDNEYLVSVTQPTGGTVTVYNNSAFKTATADVKGTEAQSDVIDDNAYFKLTAPSGTCAVGTDKNGVFALNSDVKTGYVEVHSNGKHVGYTAKADGIITMYIRFVGNKQITCENVTDKTKTQIYINDSETAGSGDNSYGTATFNVTGGKEYDLYSQGGTGRLFGVKYESTDYPSSTTSLTVNKGDEVRVVATPATNYVNKKIIINGEEKTDAKEYTFKATESPTNVTAMFEAEPPLVNGSVATDAALTREVMGAILYDAYEEFQKNGDETAKGYMKSYMSNNGGVPSPSDPNYDPNIKYEGTPYIPLTGWGALTDKGELSDDFYMKVKEAYNLGLMRTETGIARASIANGLLLQPKDEVTRAKAAKALVFAFILTQNPSEENQRIPGENQAAKTVADIVAPNANAPSTLIGGSTVAQVGLSEDDGAVELSEADNMDVSAPVVELLDDEAINVDFTKMTTVPVYSEAAGQGFVSRSSSIMPTVKNVDYRREVASTDKITVSTDGAKITESDGSYLHKKNNSDDGDDFNNGGLIYRINTGKAGAYHLEVEVAGTNADTIVQPTGMNGANLTGTGNWDNCNHVSRTVSATWDGSKWSYDFATGEQFIEIEIEPKTLPTASAPQTVGVKSIKVTPIAVNSAGDKPTIHILGDSTQKTYSFNETISAWGQTLVNYFDPEKVNVINYSMGGRAMKSNYMEGRFDELLIRGKQGDYVFIHSAHNDETVSTNRFSRGAGSVSGDFTINDANYNKWLDMYVAAIKARGMTPVLVTAMPRVNGSTGVPNSGFNPNSPVNMRAKATADSEVALAELYDGAKAYIAKLDGKEVGYIYNNTEAGETPAANAANGANGDGTHYREAASKMWSRIILQSIYDQSVATTDTYTDKAICEKLVALMPESVKSAAQSGDWSAVFPEMASDVSAVDVVPGATKQTVDNFYYRNNIEKALQLGLLHKDSQNLFKPTQTITVGEFARGIEKAFGLAENSLTNYTKTYAELQAN